MMRLAIVLCLLLPAVAAAQEVTIGGLRVRYALPVTPCPCPTVITLAGSAEDGMNRDYQPIAATLRAAGWLSLSVDLPAHGADARATESTSPLFAWRQRALAGEAFIDRFTGQLRAVLDYGVSAGAVDPRRIVVVGFSRGGFLALHAAAADARITSVAAIQPVTDLLQLSEWQGVPASVADPLGVRALVPTLVGRRIWLSIGWQDTRVGTQAAIEVVSAARALGAGWTLLLHPERDGAHTVPAWLVPVVVGWLSEP
jgi:dienelactone hydrolase